MKSTILAQAQKILGHRRWYVMMSLATGYDERRLAENLGVSKPTIQGDVAFLKKWYGIDSTLHLSILSLAIFKLDTPELKSAE